ncbi:MAG: cytochrome P450 [Acidobacteriota bacterium]
MSTAPATEKLPDILEYAARINPYPVYHALRQQDPVQFHEGWGGWLLTSYRDIGACLKDPRLSASGTLGKIFDTLPEENRQELTPLRDHLERWMGNLEPPTHTRVRSPMQRAFTPRLVEEMRPLIQQATDELLDEVQDRGEMDVVGDLAYPLPATVIANMLGVAFEDRDRFRQWSEHITDFLGAGLFQIEAMRLAQRTVLEMTEYMREMVVDQRRKGPQDNLIGRFVEGERQGHPIDLEELLANCVLLLYAGHETTTILLGNSLHALFENPDQLERIQRDPDLIDGSINEFLRYDSPVQMIQRSAFEDVEIGGKSIRKGEVLWLVLGAANRDPDQFADPDLLDVTRREDNRHFAFGLGTHFCLGAALAITEIQISLRTLLRRMPNLRPRPQAELEWVNNPITRALKALPVDF